MAHIHVQGKCQRRKEPCEKMDLNVSSLWSIDMTTCTFLETKSDFAHGKQYRWHLLPSGENACLNIGVPFFFIVNDTLHMDIECWPGFVQDCNEMNTHYAILALYLHLTFLIICKEIEQGNMQCSYESSDYYTLRKMNQKMDRQPSGAESRQFAPDTRSDFRYSSC